MESLFVLSATQSVNLKSPWIVSWLHNKIQIADTHIPNIHLYRDPMHRALRKLIIAPLYAACVNFDLYTGARRASVQVCMHSRIDVKTLLSIDYWETMILHDVIARFNMLNDGSCRNCRFLTPRNKFSFPSKSISLDVGFIGTASF